ncbi:hypothetical protein PybrP1_009858 [[Pythium] brassicae (nom. inval.)]|nr:hypothetical protein PybrP1_009858 [[Pythium] brassicae (nom. inval.)]
MCEEDMCRVGADIARACFVFVSKASADVDRTDQETVLCLLAVRNYNPELEIYAQLVSPVHAELTSEADADRAICLDQIKQSLMAKSVLCPGLVTLVSNLLQSAVVSRSATYHGWEREYIEGLAFETYATALPPAFGGLSFSQACDVLYRISKGGIILLGVYERGQPTNSPPPSPSPLPPIKKPPLPALKVRPVLQRRCSRSRSAPGSSMFVNPGSTMAVGAGQIFYVMSESKKLAQTASILALLHAWQSAGNSLPLPTPLPTPLRAPLASQPPSAAAAALPPRSNDASHADLDSVRVRVRPNRSPEDVVIHDTSSAKLSVAGATLTNHIIVVSDLNHVAMETFARMLRLARHSPGSEDYHAVVFLSWSATSAAMAVRMLQRFSDAFLMRAASDSKSELLRAGLLSARACVLLADKSAIQQLDGEVVDGKTIVHYLAILSIQDDFGIDIVSSFVPLMELTVPRTMKILDMEMTKRLKAATRGRRHAVPRDDDDSNELHAAVGVGVGGEKDLVQVVESENSRHLRRLQRGSSRNLVRNMYLQGADNLSSLETHFKRQQRVQYRRSLLRRQQALVEKAYFESGGTSLLPFFAAGFGFSVDIFDNILCQSFFTPGLIRFLYELLFSDDGHCHSAALGDPPDARIASSLVQIRVPVAFVGRTFGDMFTHLVTNEDVVAVGLYRRRGIECALPYVAAGPAMDTVLVGDDRVFVLAPPAAIQREQASRARSREQ